MDAEEFFYPLKKHFFMLFDLWEVKVFYFLMKIRVDSRGIYSPFDNFFLDERAQ